ncbi:hypothetical protein BG015_004183 [Linnemannia schmuckeri]|uniref:Uncharacterized protein n=1 Tax=Linnemannia schmuckeri TaxID=64567 RepID=A0A9P5VFE9_9FUNG|nr:hypothetical protein BG015_004183 [Linnemannia schmuckeri]
MNTSRPSSANQKSANASSTAAAPLRRAKVTSVAQMDISSMALSSKPVSSLPGSATMTPTNSSRASHSVTLSTPTSNGYHTVNSNTYNTYTSNTSTLPRMASVRVRSSNSVATTASFRSANGASSAGGGRRDGGSVTSDDGTISEDSDRAGDEMQLFSGGQASVGGGINLPFGSSGRHNSSSSANSVASGLVHSPSSSTVGPKVAGRSSRHRATSSTAGLTFGSGSSQVKPMRMAAGASIKIDPSLSLNNQNILQSSLLTTTTPGSSTAGSLVGATSPAPLTSSTPLPTWSNTPSPNAGLGSSLSRSGSLGHSRSGDEGSALSIGSGMSASSSQPLQQTGQQQQQSTIRSVKSPSATTSATVKQAEENRRIEDAARTRRKIADLEISNASLLSINQSLEATIRKQASEVQELKIRMQSAHYGDLGYSAADLALARSVEAIELTEEEKQEDLTFKRLCVSIEQMIFEAKSALDQCSKPAGVKVLSLHDMYEKEVREAQEDDDEEYEDDVDNVVDQEMSQMTFVQDDDNDDIDTKDGNMKTKYSIEVLAPQDNDEHGVRASDSKNQQQRQRQNSHEPSSTRRDSGLSRSSGESMRDQNKRQQGDGLFQDDSDDNGGCENDGSTRQGDGGGGLGLTSSPHVMISSAVLETPTIVT